MQSVITQKGSSSNSRTFDAAAFLNRAGADTITVKTILQNDMDDTVSRYKILQQVKRYREHIAIAVIEEPQDRIVAAQAADHRKIVREQPFDIVVEQLAIHLQAAVLDACRRGCCAGRGCGWPTGWRRSGS